MVRVPNHPYASFETGHDRMGQFWIVCHCSFCGHEWRKPCSRPHLANNYVFQFAVEHGHGVRPVR